MTSWGAVALLVLSVIAIIGMIVILSNPVVQTVFLLLGLGGFLVLVSRAGGRR